MAHHQRHGDAGHPRRIQWVHWDPPGQRKNGGRNLQEKVASAPQAE